PYTTLFRSRVDVNGAGEGVERFIAAAKRVESIAEIAPGIGIARMIAKIDPEFICCFHVASQGQQFETEHTAKLGQIIDRCAEMLDLFVAAVHQLQLRRKIAMGACVWRPPVEHRLPERESRAIFAVALNRRYRQ